MVWGCIVDGKKGPLVVLDYPGGKGGGMTSACYRDQVLDPVLKDFYHQVAHERGRALFQQDNALSHKSRATLSWLNENRITRFPHPASSPDLNPIEGVWHELKEIVRHSPHPPTSVGTLKKAVLSAWDTLSIDSINKYTQSMERRVESVLRARGGHTRF
ncbi:hypothetical protein NP233_g1951 [Leucocoprinus birnbaumii]|uniref:Tc1-like transposase DDE domain-containing protein n=1 Tax=Leucocoprinus birnbaumii TaxID=56174 RepID=A0AAD5VZ30_9AGAR|nr:hypothetical protein NP233_g1951 [Leucocoprinus birnbaumii]